MDQGLEKLIAEFQVAQKLSNLGPEGRGIALAQLQKNLSPDNAETVSVRNRPSKVVANRSKSGYGRENTQQNPDQRIGSSAAQLDNKNSGKSKRCREPLSVLPCSFRGTEVTGVDRDRLGLAHSRIWYWCDHPERPQGEAVCCCKTCGNKCRCDANCSGYTKPPPDESRGGSSSD